MIEKQQPLNRDKETLLHLASKVRLVYQHKIWKPVYSDSDEEVIVGYDCIQTERLIQDFEGLEKLNDFVGELSVQEGESEGMESFKVISREVAE